MSGSIATHEETNEHSRRLLEMEPNDTERGGAAVAKKLGIE